MRTVPVAIGAGTVGKGVERGRCTVAELVMACPYSCIDHVDIDAFASAKVLVSLRKRPHALIDPIETPRRRIGLDHARGDTGILLDKGHLRLARNKGGASRRSSDRKPPQRVAVRP